MMLGTRSVLAVMAGVVMVIAIPVFRSGRRSEGLWLLTIGFFLATLWSAFSLAWARSHPGALSFQSYFLLATMAVAGTIYYGMLAREVDAER